MPPIEFLPTHSETPTRVRWAEPLWERQPGEPARWFARFKIYLHLGEPRSIDTAFQAYQQAVGSRSEDRAPGSWKRSAVRWRWRDRAWEYETWRDKERSRRETEEVDARRRLAHRCWEAQVETAIDIVAKSRLDQLDAETARKLLPSAVRLLQSASAGHRHLPNDPHREGGGVIRIVLNDEEFPNGGDCEIEAGSDHPSPGGQDH